MKILHTSDLHIGKRINEYSMLDEQRFVFKQLIDIAQQEQPDAIILAGDIYDKSVPSAEAVSLFDELLVKLAKLGKAIFVISGNHDSAERIGFASRIMEESRVYLSPVYNGTIEPIILHDQAGTEVAFYLLPFIKPSLVAHYADEEAADAIKTYDDAMRYAVSQMQVDGKRRNVLITHQLITNAERSESEEVMVGGLDNIDAQAFDAFDYVALGHLHRPQDCGCETVRYSGSPLKYSFSEVNDEKSVTLVSIEGNKAPVVTCRPLTPQHNWYDLRGTYDELTDPQRYSGTDLQEAYVRITLTDEDDIPDGMRKLKAIYHRLMELRYDNTRTRAGMSLIDNQKDVKKLNPAELFADLYEQQNNQPMNEEQQEYLQRMIREVWGE